MDAILGRATEGRWPGRLKHARSRRAPSRPGGGAEEPTAEDDRGRSRGRDLPRSRDPTPRRRHPVLGRGAPHRHRRAHRPEGRPGHRSRARSLDGPREVSMARCVELGHALGNQHWPAVVKGTRVYVPLTVARAVMASVMKTHAFEGVTYALRTRRGGHSLPGAARGPAAVRRRRGTSPRRCAEGPAVSIARTMRAAPVRGLPPADRLLLVLQRPGVGGPGERGAGRRHAERVRARLDPARGDLGRHRAARGAPRRTRGGHRAHRRAPTGPSSNASSARRLGP